MPTRISSDNAGACSAIEQDAAAARHPALGHSRKYTFVAFKPLASRTTYRLDWK